MHRELSEAPLQNLKTRTPESGSPDTIAGKGSPEPKMLQPRKETVEALFSATSDFIYLVDADGVVLAGNPSFLGLNAQNPQHVIGETVFQVLPPDMSAKMRQSIGEVVQTGKTLRYQENLGQTCLDMTLAPVVGSDGRVEAVAVFSRDITEVKKALESMDLAARIIEGSKEGIVITDRSGTILDVNSAFCKLTGYNRDEVVGKNPRMMKSDRHEANFYREMWHTLRATGHWQGEVWDRRKTGEVFPKLLSISSVRNDAGRITHYVGIFSDISQIKETEVRLQQMAHHDPLTRLPNRLLFRDRLQYALVDCSRHNRTAALMMLDLDRFKHVNDTLGHRIGDDLLVNVACRLTGCLRESDTVARIGGDEFAIVLSQVTSGRAAAGIAKKIGAVLAEPFDLHGHRVNVSASVGITLYPNDGTSADRLLQNADMALYRAKEAGKNSFRFFSPEMNLQVQKRLELERELRQALERDELEIYYHPRIDCRTGSLTGLEALLRWNHPTQGLVSPADFISIAEETGLILPIGELVVAMCCRHVRQWQQAGAPQIPIAVNISGRQLSHAGLVDSFVRIIEEEGVTPEFLELELSESAAMQDADTTTEVFHQCKSHGMRVCIDDFGTGYSSLSYLKRFGVDRLKIDRSLIEVSPSDPDDKAVVATVVAMAHTLDFAVVAEGVETMEQLSLLQSLDCDEWQGYLCSRPVPFDSVSRLVRERWNRWSC
jgi:diguanylate cyclase (GGDEF)-like protein/PAS domain S-box-containing protein